MIAGQGGAQHTRQAFHHFQGRQQRLGRYFPHLAGQGLFQAARLVQGQQAPGAHDPHHRAVLGLVHVMRGDHDGDPLGRQVVNQIPEGPPRHRVDPAGGLVQKQQPGLVHDGGRQCDALPPAGGQVLHALALHRLQPQAAEQVLHPVRVGHTVDPGVEIQVLAHGQLIIQGKLLRHVAAAGAHRLRLGGDIVTQHLGPPLAGV